MQLRTIITLALSVMCSLCSITMFGSNDIRNDQFWTDTNGDTIYSQGGGIFRFADPQTGLTKYYWYGVHYKEAEKYAARPYEKYDHCTFVSVSCYSSTDLINWQKENDVLTRQEVSCHEHPGWLGRMGVAYLKEAKIYALLIQLNNKVLIATGKSATDNFKWHKTIDMTSRIGTSNTGDQTIFTDEDTGLSYLIYSYGKGRNKGYISRIGINDNGEVDLMDCHQVFKGASREGNCMFKYKNKYYLCASNIYGWDCSYAYYLVADDIYGPYTPTNNMEIMKDCDMDFAHVTQTGFFVTVKGSKQETVIYCGDRWADFAGNGLGYNQWVPLSFEGNQPVFNSISHWCIDATTGLWSVGKDNNYVLNGSFESDRNAIPSRKKPIQEQLTGWNTEIIKGNNLSVTDDKSPQLNYYNTIADKDGSNGGRNGIRPTAEKSLNINDNVDFERVISQRIHTSNNITLQNGERCLLTAKVKHSGKFKKLIFGATNGTTEVSANMNKGDDNVWHEVIVKELILKNNAPIDIFIRVRGKAGASAQIDDISLKKL